MSKISNRTNVKTGTRWGILVALAPVCFFLLPGCRDNDSSLLQKNTPAISLTSLQLVQNGSVQNRASQIEVLATRVDDFSYVSKSNRVVKTTFPEVLIKWRNNGPEPVGMVRAKIQTWDSKGKELSHSPATVTIFFARTGVRRIRPKQVYDEPSGKGHALLFGPPKAARVKATIVYADSAVHAWDDIHAGRDVF